MGPIAPQPLHFAQAIFRVIQDIRDLKNLSLEQDPPGNARSSRRKSKVLDVFSELWRVTVTRCRIKPRVSRTQDLSTIGVAQPCCRLDQCAKHGLRIEGRAADDLKHVGGGGLLLQRLAQLVKKPRILDSDDRLAGKIRDHLNLLFAERLNLLTV